MEDEELYNEILWVLKNYGSNALEKSKPGSKIKSQAERITKFVIQRKLAYELLRTHNLDLVKVVSRTNRVID